MNDKAIKFINGNKDPLPIFDILAQCIIEYGQERKQIGTRDEQQKITQLSTAL